MSDNNRPIKHTYNFLRFPGSHQGVHSVLYEPEILSEKSQIAVLVMHSDNSSMAAEAASN